MYRPTRLEVDDKAAVNVGEPEQPLQAVARNRKGITGDNNRHFQLEDLFACSLKINKDGQIGKNKHRTAAEEKIKEFYSSSSP